MFVDDSNGTTGTHYRYARSYIEEEIASAARETSTWAGQAMRRALDVATTPAKKPRVLVVGSTSPRREALALHLGAGSTTTLEYNALTFEHPLMRTVRVADFDAAKYRGSFDVVLADSSLDHDGLGRYGDPIAPDGDLLAMDALKKLVRRPNGTLVVSVPVGPDLLAFNLMRIYGDVRLPLLLDGFERLDAVGFEDWRVREPTGNFRKTYEPFFVLRPTSKKKKATEQQQGSSQQTPQQQQQQESSSEEASHHSEELRR